MQIVRRKRQTNGERYPDLMAACDKKPESAYYRREPILLVEVISPTTERIDRNEKLPVL